MSSTNGSEPVEPTRTPRRATPTSTDPEVLAAEIERTREDLAETLDAIAEKVSPKRVADRTRKKVADALTSAKETVVEQAGVARGRATEAAGTAKDRASDVKERVTGSGGAHAGVSGAPGSTSPSLAKGGLPPVTAVQADGLDLSLPTAATPPPTPTGTFPTAPATPTAGGAGPRPELLAGGALGLLVLLLLRRRRTRRKAVKTGALAALAGAGAELRSDYDKARKKSRERR